MMKNNGFYLGSGAIFLSTFLYSWTGILSKFIGLGLPLFLQSVFRSSIAALLFALTILYLKEKFLIDRTTGFWLFLRSLAGVFAFILFYLAVNYLEIGISYFLFYATVLFGGYGLGRFVFGEKINSIEWMALFIALIGLVILFINPEKSNSFQALYFFYALGSGFCTAVWNTFTKKVSSEHSAMKIGFYDSAFSATISFFISIILRESWNINIYLLGWQLNAALALIFYFTGSLVAYGFRKVDSQIGSLIMLIEIPMAIILGYLFFAEKLGPTTALGGGLIITAVLLPQIYKLKQAVHNHQ